MPAPLFQQGIGVGRGGGNRVQMGEKWEKVVEKGVKWSKVVN
jgi:hypothetical protein